MVVDRPAVVSLLIYYPARPLPPPPSRLLTSSAVLLVRPRSKSNRYGDGGARRCGGLSVIWIVGKATLHPDLS